MDGWMWEGECGGDGIGGGGGRGMRKVGEREERRGKEWKEGRRERNDQPRTQIRTQRTHAVRKDDRVLAGERKGEDRKEEKEERKEKMTKHARTQRGRMVRARLWKGGRGSTGSMAVGGKGEGALEAWLWEGAWLWSGGRVSTGSMAVGGGKKWTTGRKGMKEKKGKLTNHASKLAGTHEGNEVVGVWLWKGGSGRMEEKRRQKRNERKRRKGRNDQPRTHARRHTGRKEGSGSMAVGGRGRGALEAWLWEEGEGEHWKHGCGREWKAALEAWLWEGGEWSTGNMAMGERKGKREKKERKKRKETKEDNAGSHARRQVGA